MASSIRTGAERIETLEKHLRFHAGREVAKVAQPPPAAAVAAAAPAAAKHVEEVKGLAALLPLSAAQMKWAPAVLAVLGCVAAWRNRAQTKEQLFNLMLRGGMWVLRSNFGGPQVEPAPDRFLQEAELSTHHTMTELGSQIEASLPLEESIRKLKDKTLGLSKEAKLALWLDVEVYALARIVVGAFTLGIAHFVSTTVHALSPGDMRGDAFLPASEVHDLPLDLDLPLMIKTASTTCREALRKRGLDKLTSKAEYDDIKAVLDEMKQRLLDAFGLAPPPASRLPSAASTNSLHEAVLGEEASPHNSNGTPLAAPASHPAEPELKRKLRDLLEAAAPRALLTQTVDSFVRIACQHVTSMLLKTGSSADSKDSKISVAHLFPRLSQELKRFTEDDNEYLLSLRHGEEDSLESQWAAFFLDLNALEAPVQQAVHSGAACLPDGDTLMGGDEFAQLTQLLSGEGGMGGIGGMAGLAGDGDAAGDLQSVQALLAGAQVGAMPERATPGDGSLEAARADSTPIKLAAAPPVANGHGGVPNGRAGNGAESEDESAQNGHSPNGAEANGSPAGPRTPPSNVEAPVAV